MREIAEIELAIQGGTEKIETLGEQGKVDESMREMAAIEALKSEKADKEVRTPCTRDLRRKLTRPYSENCNNSPTRRARLATKSSGSATFVVLTSPSSTPIVVSPTTSVVRYAAYLSTSSLKQRSHSTRCIWVTTSSATCC